jgi:site-specific DNA-cytosine methylase
MRVLVACECSGIVRDAFRSRGHDAWSCDLQECEADPRFHIQADATSVIRDGWDMLIAHPPCTYLSRAGARWWKDEARQAKADEAAEFVFAFRDAPIDRIAIENPIGQLNRRWRYPDQVIQPWHFGHPYSKATCLWLKNLPPLMSSVLCDYTPLLPSNVGAGKRKGQQSHRGHTRNAKDASRTFKGIADAMAQQWGTLPLVRAA